MQQCFLGVKVEMSFNGLRLEYALEGNSNYIAWKDRMEVVLDDKGLKEFIEAEVPRPTNAAHIEVWQKKTTMLKGSVGGREGSHCIQPAWKGFSIPDVESVDRFIPKQERPKEVGAQR